MKRTAKLISGLVLSAFAVAMCPLVSLAKPSPSPKPYGIAGEGDCEYDHKGNWVCKGTIAYNERFGSDDKFGVGAFLEYK